MVKFSGKRPNCLFEVYTQFRKFVQDANVAKKRDGTCLSHYNEFVRDHKLPTNSEKFDVGPLLFENWIDQSEDTKNKWLNSWKEFPFIQPISSTRFGSIFDSMETYLKNIPLIQKIKIDEEYEDQSELISKVADPKVIACMFQATSCLKETMKKLDCDNAKISNVVELLLDMVEALCQVKNDSYKKIKLPLQPGIHGPARPVHDFLSLSFAGLAGLNCPGTSDISKN